MNQQERNAKATRQYIRSLLIKNRRLRYALKMARLERDAARHALSEENLDRLAETLEESMASLARAKAKRKVFMP